MRKASGSYTLRGQSPAPTPPPPALTSCPSSVALLCTHGTGFWVILSSKTPCMPLRLGHQALL